MRYTFQDFEKASNKESFLYAAITDYRASDEYNMALAAEAYYAQQNTTIREMVRYVYSQSGLKAPDFTAANNKIASNFLRRFINQRVTYSLGNGIIWKNTATKKRLGKDFDTFVFKTAKAALIDGAAFGYWNKNRGHTFAATEFMPLYDEDDGKLRAGARFWSLQWGKKPVCVVLYEEDGYTTYRGNSEGGDLQVTIPKQSYLKVIQKSEANGETVVGELNYGVLPVLPLYANDVKQCPFAGLRAMIDAYDIIQSGFANDLQDCAGFYMLVGGALGMEPADLEKFRDQLRFLHIGVVDTDHSSVTPYTQEVPYAARQTCLEQLRSAMYEAFGALDVTHISSSARTATEINAAYQPMDEEADDFEYQIINFILGILDLTGIDDFPDFKRNRISNQMEQTQMVMMAKDYLDKETLLSKLTFITVDEVAKILKADEEERKRQEAEMARQAALQGVLNGTIRQPQAGSGSGNAGAGGASAGGVRQQG